jgi:hypothetical protein
MTERSKQSYYRPTHQRFGRRQRLATHGADLRPRTDNKSLFSVLRRALRRTTIQFNSRLFSVLCRAMIHFIFRLFNRLCRTLHRATIYSVRVVYAVVRFVARRFASPSSLNSSVLLRASPRDDPFNFKFSLSVASRTSQRNDSFYFRFSRVCRRAFCRTTILLNLS